MTDKSGIELKEGDLVHVLFELVTSTTGEIFVFRSMDTAVKTNMLYYPLNEIGVNAAKYKNDVFDDKTEEGLFRKEDFVVTNIKPKHLIKINPEYLDSVRLNYYNGILAQL